MRLLPVGDELVEVHVRESTRARRLRIIVAAAGPPEIVVPRGTTESCVAAFLAEHERWLASQLASRRPPQLALEPLTEGEGRRRAWAAIQPVAATEAERLGAVFKRIAIRDQRTRWGSCSSRGTLSFNWRLALAPPDVLDYVVVHEVCHLRDRNHSPGFWRLVERARPDFRAPRAWLSEHGWELLAYSPVA